jgi:mono/diheme cytochrome c family protein
LLTASRHSTAAYAETPQEAFFHTEVAPILSANCLECHNRNSRKGSLSLETAVDAAAGGDEGPAVVAGNVEESLLLAKITPSGPGEAPEMPQKKPPLSAADVAKIRRWIAEGAAWPKEIVLREKTKADRNWWSLRPLAAAEPPSPAGMPAAWSTSAIDRFVYAKLAEKELAPNPPADPRDFIRRVTYDLTGLPPTPEEVEAFVREVSGFHARKQDGGTEGRRDGEKVYEALVDRLLASPRYGERWGRHWLDVVRFGESNGYERNVPIDDIWPFRDYVIRSFNEDKPLDRFIQEHLAGDVLAPGDPKVEIGTAFLVCGPYDNVGNQDPVAKKRIRSDALDDMITAVGGSFLGLTLNCSRCHDHKFDPILQADYYRLSAALDGVTHAARPLATKAQRAALDRYEREVAQPLRDRQAAAKRELAELEKSLAERHAAELKREASSFPQSLVSTGTNIDLLEPHEARFLRLTVHNTRGSPQGRSVKIEELAVWSDEPKPKNVAAAAAGGKAWVASQRPSETPPEAYGAPHLIDGRYGAAWNAGDDQTAVLQWPKSERIGRIEFSTDRSVEKLDAKRHDASVGDYTVETSLDGKVWHIVYESDRMRPPVSPDHARARLVRLFGTNAERERYAAARAELATTTEELKPAADRLAELAIELAAVRSRLKSRGAGDPAAAPEKAEVDRLERTIAAVRKLQAEIPKVPNVFAGKFAEPSAPTTTYLGGDVTKPGEAVVAASPSMLPADVTKGYQLKVDAPERDRRLALARWLTADDNPLVPRVLANRVWHYHFGTGIVDTPSDFGFMGGRPTHPELLDWLALRLKHHGMRLKPLHREIVMSQAYRQSSAFRPEAAKVDGDSRLLWRFPPRRLSAEEVRDSMLFTAGVLGESRRGGPGFRLFRAAQDNVVTYLPLDEHPPETYRRAVYHQHVRAGRFDLLTEFDLPDSAMAAPRRSATTTPLQAFTLLNHRFTLDMAAKLAERSASEAKGNVSEQIAVAYRRCFGREPDAEETAEAAAFIKRFGAAAWCRAVYNAGEFLYVP